MPWRRETSYFLDFTCKWYHTVFIFDLFHLAWSLQVHPCCCKWQNFLYYGWVVYHCVCMYTVSSVDGHWGSFHILSIVNNAAVNIGIPISFQISVFVFFGYMPRNEIIWSYSSYVFSFMRNFPTTVFYSGSISLHPHQQFYGLPFLHICYCVQTLTSILKHFLKC